MELTPSLNSSARSTSPRARPRREKPATEQPGNSFKYLYWRLTDKGFQQLCSAILRHKYDPVRTFPVGMADEGIDAMVEGDIVYQVKWSSKVERNPETWLDQAIAGERSKIKRLVRQGRISRYILMTSVAGTTTAEGTGSIQKLDEKLSVFTAEFGIPVECWWQSDIDAEVDALPDSVKWSYEQMLAGTEAVRYLMFGSEVESTAAKMRDTMIHVMATQWSNDSKVQFSQVELDRVNVADLFVDVHASVVSLPRQNIPGGRETRAGATRGATRGAVRQLLSATLPLTFLLGVPGQGKSTLGQYLCQVHRAAILPEDMLGSRSSSHEAPDEPKLPLRIDLREYASWLSGIDPFDDEPAISKPRMRSRSGRSLELFLADFCTANSGGRSVTVEEIQGLFARYPTLLVLDGLDEIADASLRGIVVDEINQTASRLRAVDSRVRAFQILVTARPNASGLAEPDGEDFQILRLEPLSASLQTEFVTKWCDANDIDGKARQRLRRIFRDRTALDHVAQLADNPMQLTILLYLINQKGDAVPVSRTPLYTAYMATLLDREVNRQQIDRDQVPRVQEVTAFLGWHMHSGVESTPDAGRMSFEDFSTTLLIYFRRSGRPDADVDSLFTAASDRFWALTSKVDKTYEFTVQPVREYFAAKFLAEWAGADRRETLSKQSVLRELLRRSYWLNTARFFAGFASPNELASLRYALEDVLEERRHPLQERVAVWTLLADGIFANSTQVQRDVIDLLADEITISLASGNPATTSNFPPLPGGSGGAQLSQALRRQLDGAPRHASAPSRARVLRDRAGMDRDEFMKWWRPRMDTALGSENEIAWLQIAAAYGQLPIPDALLNSLDLSEVEAQKAAISAGAAPEPNSKAARMMLTAVLDGHASDLRIAPASEAGALLRAMRPQWFESTRSEHAQDPQSATGHLQLRDIDKSTRAAAWKRLVEIDPKYAALKKAARARSLNQQGTTEPWQNPARELTKLHGPSWLAAEIAVAGAAVSDAVPSGSADPSGEPFGEETDYGTLVMTLRKGPNSAWWRATYDKYADSLSRRTWVIGMIACADEDTITEHAPLLHDVVDGLSDVTFHTMAESTSRIGLTRRARPIRPAFVNMHAAQYPRVSLMMSHFSSNAGELLTLDAFSDEALVALASSSPASWPIAQALSVRMLQHSNQQLCDGLRRLDPDVLIGFRQDGSGPAQSELSEILNDAARFPKEWVAAADRWTSSAAREPDLDSIALKEKWIPEVPRLSSAS